MNKIIKISLFLILLYLIYNHTFNKIIENNDTLIKVEKSIINLGEINEKDEAIAIFKIINISLNNIIIERVESDCHCTIINLKEKIISPKENIEITLKYDKSSKGFFEQTAIIYLKNSPTEKLLIMRGVIL